MKEYPLPHCHSLHLPLHFLFPTITLSISLHSLLSAITLAITLSISVTLSISHSNSLFLNITVTLSLTITSFYQEIINEGYYRCRYYDSKGITKIGVGFNLEKTEAESRIQAIGAKHDRLLSGSIIIKCKHCLNKT